MVLCTAGSKRAEFSQAGKIMYQSHCPSLFLWCSSSSVDGITYKFRVHATINLFLPSCLSFPAGSPARNDLIYSITISRYPVALELWASLRAPVHTTYSQRKCVSLVLFWQHTFWTLAWASWYFSESPPLSQPLPREKKCWQDTKRTTRTGK